MRARSARRAKRSSKTSKKTRLDLLLLFLAGALSGSTATLVLVAMGAVLGAWQ